MDARLTWTPWTGPQRRRRSTTEAHSLSRTWLDAICTIKATAPDRATLARRDGSQRMISLVNAFRVLFLTNSSGGTEKIDLADIGSVKFVPAWR